MTEIKYNNEINDNPKQTFWINNFTNCKSPEVLGKISIEDFLHKIKHGDENLLNIKNAREFGKGHDQYDKIKTTVLPTYRFNFHMEGTAKNLNVTDATGLIYIDVDDNIEIPHSDFIYAKWRSLSNTGYGILVKVDNLTLDNFKDVYDSLGMTLGIKVDDGARKAIQQNVLSYDPSLYCNCNSRVYEYEHSKKASPNSIKKKRECIGVNDASVNQNRIKERIDNSYKYFVGDNSEKEYLFFEEKIMICAPFMPWHGVEKGNRNNLLFRILSQFALLNPDLGKDYLLAKSNHYNKKMQPFLSRNEIYSVISSVLEKRKEGTLVMYYNKERLILFNPNLELSNQQKSQLVGYLMGRKKTKETQTAIYEIIENWDFEQLGQIKQISVIKISKFSRSKVQRHWFHFKDYVEDLNKGYKRKSA